MTTIRMAAAVASATLAAAALLAPARPHGGEPLWPGARYTRQDRDAAVHRGLLFLADMARQPVTFQDYGHDLVGAFSTIFITSAGPGVRSLAWRIGRERARAWRRLNASVPPGAGPDVVSTILMGSDAAERFGLPDPALRQALRAAAARFTPVDYYGWDPAREPPPIDLPEPCRACRLACPRGAAVCARCGRALAMRSRYDLWTDALIGAYMGGRFGVRLGADWKDVARWRAAMRPYPRHGSVPDREFDAAIYAVTHLIYTGNDYSEQRISPECLPEEFDFLRDSMREFLRARDPETTGELLDTLRAFGLGFSDPLIRAGAEFLLDTRNPDGSWGDPKETDPYIRYHTTWTAVDGLREYRWTPAPPCLAP